MQRVIKKISLIREINIFKYIYLNYFCKNVIRHGLGKIIPYKKVCIEFEHNSEIHIYKGSIEIGKNKIRGSKAETYLRLRKGAKWNAFEYCDISYGSTIEVLSNALLETKYFTVNSNSTIIAQKHIFIGNNVMIGRNVTIYDSDFHNIYDENDQVINQSKDVTICDNVWIGTNATILKGVCINDGSVIAANSIITSNVQNTSIVATIRYNKVIYENIKWVR